MSVLLSNSETQKDIQYSITDVQGRKHLCYCALCLPSNNMEVLAWRAPDEKSASLAGISPEQKKEILLHLNSYTEKMLVCDMDGRAVIIVPSIYPSSSLCIALVFDPEQITLSEFLRLIENNRFSKMFELSEFIQCTPARMTRMLEKKAEDFFELCCELERLFVGLDKLASVCDESEGKRILLSIVSNISYFVGCPLESLEELWKDEEGCSQTDMPLFSAFLLCFLLIARECAPYRSAKIELRASSSSALPTVVFESERDIALSSALLEWERLAFDKNMLFECDRRGNEYRISFLPLRRDWSYLRLKQKVEFI